MPISSAFEQKFEEEKIKSDDLLDIGGGVSVFFQLNLADRHALRARVGYSLSGKKSHDAEEPYHEATTSASLINAMADYVYAFYSHDYGFYLVAGAGFLSARYDETLKYYVEVGDLPDEPGAEIEEALELRKWKGHMTEECLIAEAGVGFNFTKNMALELKYAKPIGLKYQWAWERRDPKLDANWDWVTLSFSCRF
jgi:opacity protein-like surface antigen